MPSKKKSGNVQSVINPRLEIWTQNFQFVKIELPIDKQKPKPDVLSDIYDKLLDAIKQTTTTPLLVSFPFKQHALSNFSNWNVTNFKKEFDRQAFPTNWNVTSINESFKVCDLIIHS